MQRSFRWLILASFAFLLISAGLIVVVTPSHIAFASFRLTPTATPSPSSATAGSGSGWWPDSTIIGALIGLGVVLFGIWATFYQTRRSERLQRELTAQSEKLQRDLAQQNEQVQRELVRTQKELERQYDQLQKST